MSLLAWGLLRQTSTFYDAFGQRPISQLFTSLNQYFVIMEVNPQFQLGPDALQRICVKSQTAGTAPLSELVMQQATVAPLGRRSLHLCRCSRRRRFVRQSANGLE